MTSRNKISVNHRRKVLHGGRITTLHLLPQNPVAVAVKKVLMASAITLGSTFSAHAGSCTETGGGGSGIWTCSGLTGSDMTQTLSPSVDGNIAVKTEAGFGIDVADGDAIQIINASGDSDVTFSDDFGSMISAQNDGIIARNYSSGALSVTSTGTVVGTNGFGIGAYSYGSDLTISAVNAIGGEYGIGAANFGTGAVSVTSTGSAVGRDNPGIGVFNLGTDLTISAVNTSGGDYGIGAAHFGTGAVTITSTGTAIGGLDGIYAYAKGGNGTDITITAVNSVGNRNGIRAYNSGSGEVRVTSTGNVEGITSDGIYASNSVAGTDLIVSTADVVGATNGIFAINNGTGLQSITVSGNVKGGDGFGIKTETLAGKMTEISLEEGAHVSSTAGLGIENNHGDSLTTIHTGASVSGEIQLNGGSDNLIFAGGDFSGVSRFDGGDDFGSADGFIDVLSFNGSSGELSGASVLNWERLEIGSGSRISFSDSMLTAGTLVTKSNGALDVSGHSFQLSGNFSNGGTLTMLDGAVSDSLTVSGDYSGTGILEVDADFATNSSDQLIISGNVSSGTTLISVADVTEGNASGKDVVLVEVAGTTQIGDFALSGGPITSGVFDYDLANKGRQWVLSGAVNATGAVYEALPLILSGFNRLPDFNQRQLQRSSTEIQPMWIRFSGDSINGEPDSSTSGLSFDRKKWGLQAGHDFLLDSGPTGDWILSATLQHGLVSADVQNSTGTGNIKTLGFGIGSTVTFLGDSGFYVDLQGQLNWLDSDIDSSASGELFKNHKSKAYALSIELGQSFSLPSGGDLTPQVQLTWGQVNGDSFIDFADNAIVPGTNESSVLRLGLTYVSEPSQNGQYYVLSNVLRDFSGEQITNAAGTTLTSHSSNTMGEVGIGGEMHLSPDQKLDGELRYQGSLDGSGNNGVSFAITYSKIF